jgi:flavin-dependent dehydrogenase
LKKISKCKCYPLINVGASKSSFDDRLVLIGDSGTSKLYKNGIGAAYITAKAAARAAIFSGLSKKDFDKEFGKICRRMELDNTIGKLIFLVTTIIQKSRFLKKGLQRMVRKEQNFANNQRRMSSVLWDTFTGSASYGNILKRVLHPLVLLPLIFNLVLAPFKKI